MSRLRFGSKYKGGSFANQFKNGFKKGVSMYDGPSFVTNAMEILKKKAKEEAGKKDNDLPEASQSNMNIEDLSLIHI